MAMNQWATTAPLIEQTEVEFAKMFLTVASEDPKSVENISTKPPPSTPPSTKEAGVSANNTPPTVLSFCKQNQPQKALALLYATYPNVNPGEASIYPEADLAAIFTTFYKLDLSYAIIKAFDEIYPDIETSRAEYPAVFIFELLMSSCMKIDKPGDTINYFNRLLKSGRQYPEGIITLVINAFIKCNRLPNAMYWFEELSKVNALPNEFIFNNLINALIKSNQLEEAFFYIQKMQAMGVAPDQYTYNIIIKAHMNCGDIDSAREIMTLMQRNGLLPDAYTFGPFFIVSCEWRELYRGTVLVYRNDYD